MCPAGYHHSDFDVNHARGHMIYVLMHLITYALADMIYDTPYNLT